MKKTTNISLAGLSFVIDEDAYLSLDAYIRAVREHLATYKDADEIVNDIEARFAEQFAEKAGTSHVITLPEVEAVIGSMGKPEQFAETDAPHDSKEPVRAHRLYRDSQDVILGGVAGGIGAYLGYDPLWIRLLFVLSTFFGGFGALLYLVLWIVLPEAKTETERMQMRGEPITLKGLEQILKDRASSVEANKKFGAFTSVVRTVGMIVKKIFVILVKIVGGVLAFSTIIATAAILFAVTTLIVNGDSSYIEFPLNGLAHNTLYYTALLSGVLVVIVPLIILSLLGVSITSGRSAFKRMIGYSLVGVWIVGGVVFANAAIRIAPQVEAILETDPVFKTVSQSMPVSDFTKIELGGGDTATIVPSSTTSVTIEGRERDVQSASVRVDNGVLSIHHENKIAICIFCFRKPLHLTVFVPRIDAVEGNGAAKISMEGFSPHEFTADLSGASRLTFTGNASSAVMELSGASQIDASRAEIQNVHAEVSGASRLYLGDVDTLTVDASGASRVFYRTARIVTEDTSGASSVEPR